jgi:hypothetical protein
MKPIKQEDIDKEIDYLINSIKNDWSKFGDLSEWVREDLIKRLKRIKRMIKSPQIISFNKLFNKKR